MQPEPVQPSRSKLDEHLALLAEANEQFAAYLSEVTDGDLNAPTPCTAWNINDLYHHMLELNITLANAIDPQISARRPPNDCRPRETVFRNAARYATDALATANGPASRARAETGSPVLMASEAVVMHLTNTLIHTWDLAHAIGIAFDPPRPESLDIALDQLHRFHRLPRYIHAPDAPFAATPATAPDNAIDELVLLSGRRPTWPGGHDH